MDVYTFVSIEIGLQLEAEECRVTRHTPVPSHGNDTSLHSYSLTSSMIVSLQQPLVRQTISSVLSSKAVT